MTTSCCNLQHKAIESQGNAYKIYKLWLFLCVHDHTYSIFKHSNLIALIAFESSSWNKGRCVHRSKSCTTGVFPSCFLKTSSKPRSSLFSTQLMAAFWGCHLGAGNGGLSHNTSRGRSSVEDVDWGSCPANHCQDAEITPLGQIAIAGSSRVLASLMFFNFFCKWCDMYTCAL